MNTNNNFLNSIDPGEHAAMIVGDKLRLGMTRSQVRDWVESMRSTNLINDREYYMLAHHARQNGFPT